MKILTIYASIEGQTSKIAHFIAEELGKAGHSVDMIDAQGTGAIPLDDADKVILAASVHERRHPKLFEALLIAQKSKLETLDTLLISVSLSAAFPEGMEEAGEYVTELQMRTGFKPSARMLVAGAIRAREYDYFATQVLRHVVLRNRGYDPTKDTHEFTDWDELSSRLSAFVASEPVTT